VDRAEKEGWTGLTGFVNEEKIRETIPKDISSTFFAACGPPPLVNLFEKILVEKFNVKRDRIFRF
jgi:NAD(P)H-flavin reductase